MFFFLILTIKFIINTKFRTYFNVTDYYWLYYLKLCYALFKYKTKCNKLKTGYLKQITQNKTLKLTVLFEAMSYILYKYQQINIILAYLYSVCLYNHAHTKIQLF